MEREGQKIMVARKELTQMTFTDIAPAPDQTTNSLRESIIKIISPLTSEQGTVVRTDSAPAYTRLAQEAKEPDDILNRASWTSAWWPTRTRTGRPRTPSRSLRRRSSSMTLR